MNRKAEFLRNITIKISNAAKYNVQIMVMTDTHTLS